MDWKRLEEYALLLRTDLNENNLINFIRFCRCNGNEKINDVPQQGNSIYNLACIVGERYIPYFSSSAPFLDDLAICYYYSTPPSQSDGESDCTTGGRGCVVPEDDVEEEYMEEGITENYQYYKAWDLYLIIFALPNISEDMMKHYIFNSKFCVPYIKNRYSSSIRKLFYEPFLLEEKVPELHNQPSVGKGLITFTITTCKRYDLFEKTIRSFVNCIEDDIDMISRWICVDDNSSEEDIVKMKRNFPFFEFVWKGPNERGHARSMNIILDMIKTPYVFHCEDDWLFFRKETYITDLLAVMNASTPNGTTFGTVAQVLLNKGYGETEHDINMVSNPMKTTSSGVRYYLHNYTSSSVEMQRIMSKGSNCAYWPHYSLRPSLIRTKALQDVGKYDENVNHFEMDYAYRYVQKGYISAYLDNIHCLHTGKLTTEKGMDKSNAYDLNNILQFGDKDLKGLKSFVINLDRRQDRMKTFEEQGFQFLEYKRVSAVDGQKLKYNDFIGRLFNENDYHWRRGMIGCALTHISLWIEFSRVSPDTSGTSGSTFFVLEDDAKPTPFFTRKMYKLLGMIKELQDWDILFVGYHPRDTPSTLQKCDTPSLQKCDVSSSLQKSLGGTFAYLITKKGAEKMLNFLNTRDTGSTSKNKEISCVSRGLTNCIDTMMQLASDVCNVYYTCTPLITSEINGSNTDIQYNYDSINISIEEKLARELAYFKENSMNIVEVPSGGVTFPEGTKDVAYSTFPILGLQELYDIERKYFFYILNKELVDKVKKDRFVEPLASFTEMNLGSEGTKCKGNLSDKNDSIPIEYI